MFRGPDWPHLIEVFSGVTPHKMLPLLLFILLGTCNAASESGSLKTYIIHLDHSHKPESFRTHESWHRSILTTLSHPADDQEMLLYSYSNVVNGFSARLTQAQLAEIEASAPHVATYEESSVRMFTTHTPEFLGLDERKGIWPASSYGEGVIIGLIDTGVWPESESFQDKGMAQVPQRWKGTCQNGTGFSSSSCNRKLIGARSYNKGINATYKGELDESPRDQYGHGTHTSSTAAGSHVLGASHFGYAKGTARGMAPRAHVAMYKVQFVPYDGYISDLLAGMDQAVSDGVDILSLSLGLMDQAPYYNDAIAIASLAAVEKGVTVVCAAGNDGPASGSIYNGAPWITTVGASTIDRSFTATLVLEDGTQIEGTSYYPESVLITDAELYYDLDNQTKGSCSRGALNQSEVHRKIVICDGLEGEGQKEELERVSAYAGILIMDELESDMDPDDYSFPIILVPTSYGDLLKSYMARAGAGPAMVKSLKFVSTNLGTHTAPQVASFSSRGPDPMNPGPLKPDILAPGVDVLAAVAPKQFVKLGRYTVFTDYELMSGTSMAAPHVAGVVALLKSVHPEWSPAAIRSAMMTTAYTRDTNDTTLIDQSTGSPATPLAFGAGHIDPNQAMDPGLIYNADFQDYVDFLCGLNYTAKQMKAILRRTQWTCYPDQTELNYPSFIGIFDSSPAEKKFSRVVTNVGNETSVYRAKIEFPGGGSNPGMAITVVPATISFTKKYQKQAFELTVAIDKEAPPVAYGFLRWTDQYNHVVSSPVVAVKL